MGTVEQVEQEQILVLYMEVLVQHVQFLVVAVEAEEVPLAELVELVGALELVGPPRLAASLGLSGWGARKLLGTTG